MCINDHDVSICMHTHDTLQYLYFLLSSICTKDSSKINMILVCFEITYMMINATYVTLIEID
jgi:hypothetical protein